MRFTRKSEVIRRYEERIHTPTILGESYSKSAASTFLKDRAQEFDFSKRYDVFLSHSFTDARIVRQVRKRLINEGLTVYVDWIEDKQLNRSNVGAYTALLLRHRMDQCNSLIYLTSDAAEKSVWMPWELGYMDSSTKKVAIAPIVDDDEADFPSREYLGIYPYIEIAESYMFTRQMDGKFKSVDAWTKNTYDWIDSS